MSQLDLFLGTDAKEDSPQCSRTAARPGALVQSPGAGFVDQAQGHKGVDNIDIGVLLTHGLAWKHLYDAVQQVCLEGMP